jgi:hypothetical protein
MQKRWHGKEYKTAVTSNNSEGWLAVDLKRTTSGLEELVARIVFWDAEGQFALEMYVQELPLAIVEETIAEARAQVRGL